MRWETNFNPKSEIKFNNLSDRKQAYKKRTNLGK